MTLTSGTGPLSRRRAGRFTAPVPDGTAYVEPFRRRVRGVLADGRTVVDSERVLLVHRPGGAPVWAFPTADVDGVESEPVPEARGHVEVPWGAVAHWYQEQDEVRLHAPNPYHRVEYLRGGRRLRVELAGELLVDTTDTVGVFETALEPRLYVPKAAVRMDRLRRTDTTTHCPYKGDTTYWTVVVGDVEVTDAAWSYDEPFVEATAIAGLLSFDEQKLTVTHDLPPAPASF